MDMWQKMLENQILVSSVAGWVVAQVLKTIIDCTLNHDFSPERLVGAGGMPSSHSSTVCALVVSSGICCGVSSPEFAVGFVLAAGCAGWGGLSVLCQTAAVLEGSSLRLRNCLLGKVLQGLLYAVLALALQKYVLG